MLLCGILKIYRFDPQRIFLKVMSIQSRNQVVTPLTAKNLKISMELVKSLKIRHRPVDFHKTFMKFDEMKFSKQFFSLFYFDILLFLTRLLNVKQNS